MTDYKIHPNGMNHVFKRVEGVVNGDLRGAAKSAYNAMNDATLGYPDSNSPIYAALKVAQSRAMMAVNGVVSEAGFIVSVAVDAADEYIRGDDLMAANAHHRRAAANDVQALIHQSALDKQDQPGTY